MPLHSSEKGQAFYLVVIGLVGLLGFAALAIDGGAVYSERRRAYNAADTAALTGALTIAEAGGGDPFAVSAAINQAVNDALARAAANLYDNSDPDVTVTANVLGPFTENGVYYKVEVEITSRIPTNFAHLVFNGPLENTVKAVARARPTQNITFGYSVFGNAEHECDTIWLHGTEEMNITGGGVFSNSDGYGGSCGGARANGTPDVTVNGGGIASVGSWSIQGGPSLNPPPTSGAQQIELPPVPVPDCSSLPNQGSFNSDGTNTIDPGIYGEIRMNNGSLTLNPGLYCIFGSGGININGGTVTGDGVTLYLRDGDFDIGGNALLNLFAPTDLIGAAGNQWAGMLLYMHPDNDGLVRLNGTSDTIYRGTIFAPGPPSPVSQPKCSVLGTGLAIGLESQIICYTVELAGTADLDLTYNNAQNYATPAAIELLE